MTEGRAEREDRIQTQRAEKAAAPSNAGKVVYMYMGWNEAGEFETFSDELEACRFALNGASKARVEKRELKKRSK